MTLFASSASEILFRITSSSQTTSGVCPSPLDSLGRWPTPEVRPSTRPPTSPQHLRPNEYFYTSLSSPSWNTVLSFHLYTYNPITCHRTHCLTYTILYILSLSPSPYSQYLRVSLSPHSCHFNTSLSAHPQYCNPFPHLILNTLAYRCHFILVQHILILTPRLTLNIPVTTSSRLQHVTVTTRHTPTTYHQLHSLSSSPHSHHFGASPQAPYAHTAHHSPTTPAHHPHHTVKTSAHPFHHTVTTPAHPCQSLT